MRKKLERHAENTKDMHLNRVCTSETQEKKHKVKHKGHAP